jgi:hypothetical protein
VSQGDNGHNIWYLELIITGDFITYRESDSLFYPFIRSDMALNQYCAAKIHLTHKLSLHILPLQKQCLTNKTIALATKELYKIDQDGALWKDVSSATRQNDYFGV